MHLKELCKQAHQISRTHGFWGAFGRDLNTHKAYYVHNRNDGEMIALMHSELSEALEALRQTNKNKNNVGEELADCCIRIFDYCEGRNINLEKEIITKLKKNENRPILHGKEF